ncbi:LysR substrate-binding domain-containing protein [Herbiconiux daphne]|uniref:LysR substrate-binding domain-containing protein n=1 Tax=Herbiconiux daphne TaxID=2970914 RepID=A0ABT2H7M8_9MICO|nr:LysR substrate-binding domain-containing protein [Herbiconiux daphne]MCS5735878.1 LysR substrate-binding domain-containing protein [Herbiconiux daphne]
MAFRVAFVPGVTPTKWFRVWAERRADVALEPVPIDHADQRRVLDDDLADVVFARLPIDRDGVSAIPLYAEVPVVVVSNDHEFAALGDDETVDVADLEGQRLLEIAPGPTGGADAFELVAAGVGLVQVPKSLARLHGRKDVTARELTGAPETQIVLAWRDDRRSELVDEFIGVVRGRTANSSRMTAEEVEELRRQKPTAKAKAKAAEARAAAAKAQPKGKAKGKGTPQPGRTRPRSSGRGRR